MATKRLFRPLSRALIRCSSPRAKFVPLSEHPRHLQRAFHTSNASSIPSDIAFVFDIDGVILRSSKPVGRSPEALRRLQSAEVPFLFLTNGGGIHERDRVADIQSKLGLRGLDEEHIVMSHSPYRLLRHLFDKNVLVLGGHKCRSIAESYGFQHVYAPGDLWVSRKDIWPFSEPFAQYHMSVASRTGKEHPSRIDAIFAYNDPRDWGLDMAITVDLLLSENGRLGTRSAKNGDVNLPNKGYQQDGQPSLHFSNPDLWWANSYEQPRLGQGAFREALQGIWTAITGGDANGVVLQKEVIGKPHQATYDFAETQLTKNLSLLAGRAPSPLRKVYMIGDNPESDILGANSFKSNRGTDWVSILVRTGVYQGGEPAHRPRQIVKDVYDAVEWALHDAQG